MVEWRGGKKEIKEGRKEWEGKKENKDKNGTKVGRKEYIGVIKGWMRKCIKGMCLGFNYGLGIIYILDYYYNYNY